MPILKANIAAETRIMTDEAGQYAGVKKHFAGHDFTRHGAGEYGRGEVHTNTVEGFYSVFKRGMKGVFSFRYSNRSRLGVEDAQRAAMVILGATGKRLMYRRREETSI